MQSAEEKFYTNVAEECSVKCRTNILQAECGKAINVVLIIVIIISSSSSARCIAIVSCPSVL